MNGIVKWFNIEKGYGFIKTYEGKDVYVHLSDVQKSGLRQLDEGQRVKFEIVENQKGMRAIQLVNLWPV